jgi:hypothetical protein
VQPVQPSSLVFVAIVVGWAAYLLPQWLRRRDALAQSRGKDRHSSTLRVLDRRPRGPVGPSTAPLLPEPSMPLTRPAGYPSHRPARTGPHRRSVPVAPSASAVAARRRARVLSVLLALTAASWVLVPASRIGWQAAAPATVLLVLDLLALVLTGRRRAVRRAAAVRDRRRRADLLRWEAAGRRAAAPATAPIGTTGPVEAAAEPAVARVTVSSTERPERASARVERELAVGAGTWIPVPVPPPTYTLKATAPRPEPAPLDLPGSPAPRPTDPAVAAAAGADDTPAVRTPRPWDADRSFADDLDLDAVLARRRAVNG